METKDKLRKQHNQAASAFDDGGDVSAGVSKDQVRAVKDLLRQIADHFAKEAEGMLAQKQKEILGK